MGKTTHRMTYSKEYRTWTAMLSRCRNPKDCNYTRYGQRGIRVCKRWYDFENFYADMGRLPFYEAELDRIDNSKDYCPENCRWVDKKMNCRNRRSTKWYSTHLGDFTQTELIQKSGLTKNQFRWFKERYGIEWILEHFRKGTLPQKKNRTINREDIVGKKFGKLGVLKFVSYTKKDGHLYFCECECGFQNIISRSNLVLGKSTQCRGCACRKVQPWKNSPIIKSS